MSLQPGFDVAAQGSAKEPAGQDGAWAPAIALERLERAGKVVVKIGSKQIALFHTAAGIHACNNRCPHEGYPLREGTVDGACVLTCNWHNWKFDLRTGNNLLGGDRLRLYPTRLADGMIWIDLTDPPAAERQAQALAHLRAAFDDHEYDRLARELARLAKADGDPVDALVAAIQWSHDRLEFGTTHAHAAAAGWLQLYDAHEGDEETRLICLTEAIGGLAWDTLREPAYPYAEHSLPWDEAAFLAAVEAEDEKQAVALVRGALAEGQRFADLERALSAAALRHYADFGHSLIYVVHTGRLIARLGPDVELPLLLALVRSLVYSFREELIPEFRRYGAALAAWPLETDGDAADLAPNSFRDLSINDTLVAVAEAAARVAPETLYRALLGASALNLLQFDMRWQAQTDGSIAQNIGWLDFTHALTFANAVRLQCAKFPELWPSALLQMACFIGRNSGFTDPAVALEDWRVRDRAAFGRACLARILDHGEPNYIHSAHLLKTFLAAREEVASGLPEQIEAAALAAVNRYFNEPIKRKHARRTVHQALAFVALED
jgi:nitrite reductase/ring-hydroxylating ferredoxin subunit